MSRLAPDSHRGLQLPHGLRAGHPPIFLCCEAQGSHAPEEQKDRTAEMPARKSANISP